MVVQKQGVSATATQIIKEALDYLNLWVSEVTYKNIKNTQKCSHKEL